AGEKKKVLAILDQLQKDLRLKLLTDLTDFGKARVNKLLKEATAVIDAAYGGMVPVAVDPLMIEAQKYKNVKDFISKNVTLLRERGIKNINEVTNLWKRALNEQYTPSRISLDSAVKLISDVANKDNWAGWFRNADTGYLPRIERAILTDSKLRDSGLSIMHKQYQSMTGNKISFDDFLNTDIKLYRGGVQRLDDMVSYSIDKNIAGKFGKVAEIKIRPKDTYGIFDLSAEGEVLIPRRQVEIVRGMTAESTDLLGLARSEAQATAQSFAAIGLDAALPTEAALKALVNDALIEGAPIKAWWSKQADNTAFFFNSAVRQEYQTAVSRGMSLNETVQQIVRRIIGSPRLGTPGIMETSRRGATALVHTSIQQVANDARLATFKANDDVIKGVQQLSTLDSKTTAICVAYSGASWDLDGNPINGTTLPFNGGPPRHWNCRSVLTAITKTYKELGIDIPEAPKGTRASDEGQVRSDITMTEWLKSKPTAYVDDLLGPGRSKLFLDGKITLQQLVDQTGRELTLEQLRGL
ncbi:MAG: hypothetical protein H8E17_08640, partial [Deltaproteobacteria bacterium]|nr:hypothetical protein [Deltaproteobacteria bacterium]